jgi:C-terminal processing protease CtpA/Prc
MRIRTLALCLAMAAMLAALPLSAQATSAADTPRVHRSNVKSRNGMYWGGVLTVQPDGRWSMVDYPVVTRIDSGSVAEQAGIRLHDVIVAVNGRDPREGQSAFRRRPGEAQEVLRIQRGMEEKEIVIPYPPAPDASDRAGSAGAAPPAP